MLAVDRTDFVPDEYKKLAYKDTPVPIEKGQTTSAPSMIGFALMYLDVKEGMTVLEVGTGSGYQTALLSKLVGETGKVISIEIITELVELAKARLAKYKSKNVTLVKGSGSTGLKSKAPYDRIIFSAAAKKMPQEVLNQLSDNGKLVIPIIEKDVQVLYLFIKNGDKVVSMDLGYVAFVHLVD